MFVKQNFHQLNTLIFLFLKDNFFIKENLFREKPEREKVK